MTGIADGPRVHRSLPSNSDEGMLADTSFPLIRPFLSFSMAGHKKIAPDKTWKHTSAPSIPS